MVKDEWTEIKPTTGENSVMWNYEEDKQIEGVYQGVKTNIGQNLSNIYSIKTNKGEVLSFWGTALLNDRLSGVVVGDKLKLIYLGKTKSEKTGRSYHNFQVWTAKSV